MKVHKKGCLCLLALMALASASIGAGMVTQAQSTIDESKFTMYKGASVRVEGTTEKPDAKGLRFKTYANEFKDDLYSVYSPSNYNYQWYTQLRFKLLKDGSTVNYESYTADVNANVWNDEGWNTVLLQIPTSAAATDITAQSFVEVKSKNGATVYEASTEARTYSAAETASWALAYNLYANDTQKNFLLSYVNAAVTSGEIAAIHLPNPTLSLEVGASDDIVARTEPFGYGITYTSSNTGVATVDGNGRVTGVAAGTANITMSLGTLTKTCQVTVHAKGSLPTAITSWSNTTLSWKYSDTSSKMYPFYKIDNSSSGTGQVSGNKIKVTSAPKTAAFMLNSEWLAKVFAFSQVKSVRMKLTGFNSYKIGTFIMNYKGASQSNDHIRYEKQGDVLYLIFDRAAYETYLAKRETASTKFEFRLQVMKSSATVVSTTDNSHLTTFSFTINEIAPVYDAITEDFEYGANAAISTDAASSIEKVSGRNGRGMYALSAAPTAKTLTVNIASSYANKVFGVSGATALQFRVYTDKDLSSVTVNGSTANVQYKYNADGEYYMVRIGSAYKGSNLSVVLTGESNLGQVYLDAFTSTDKALGANVTKTQAYAKDTDGELQFTAGETFNFYAYSSLSTGKLDGVDYDFSAPTLETMLELKEAGFDVIMPQSAAPVGENGAARGSYNYKEILDLAQQAGLKVILSDDPLLYLSGGKQYDASGTNWPNWKGYYESAKETSGQWAGAAKTGTTMYTKVKAQLQSYINHPAFYGVLMIDEPSAWMFDESLAVPTNVTYTKAGTFGYTYKTVKRVAQEVFGKDIFIHANILPAGNYSTASYGHGAGQRFPELTVKRYGEITGMNVSSYAVNGTTDYIASVGSAFYTALDYYIERAGATDGASSSNGFVEDAMKIEIQRERFGKYCEMFLQCTGAPYIMPDIYPIERGTVPTDRHLMEMQTVAEVAAKYNVDLHLITQTMKHTKNPERQLTEQNARWLNNQLLTFGVKNIVYFTYHVHGNDGSSYFDNNSSFVDETGEKTDVYYFMQKIMAENKAFEQTYQSFDIQSTKVYYKATAAHNNIYGHYVRNVNYRDNSLYTNDNVTFGALASVEQDSDLTLISEFTSAVGYMYAVMNLSDSEYATDYTAYDSVTLTFGDTYTHAIVWRNGVKKLVMLDANHSLEIENAAGEAVYVIPYKKQVNSDYFGDEMNKDNGAFFPGTPWAGDVWDTDED